MASDWEGIVTGLGGGFRAKHRQSRPLPLLNGSDLRRRPQPEGLPVVAAEAEAQAIAQSNRAIERWGPTAAAADVG
jgi:hypothetical protein